ncbi:hypothetical protein PC128_g18023 [Phytophthora cactorum]|nr:hypothetical protein PC128_g18023 [Phytophthora cactorum]
MRVYSAAIAAATAWTVAAAQTTQSTSQVAASSGSGVISATAGSVPCVFRYAMPTATNLPSSVTTTTSSTTSSGSDETDTSTDMSGSVGDGSEDRPGTVGVGSDSSSASTDTGSSGETQDSSADSSGSSTPTPTTKTPTSTTKTPTSTTKTPTSTTKTPSATTRTPSTSTGSATSDGSADTTLATTAPSTATTLGSNDGRHLMGEAGEAGGTTTIAGTAGVTATVPAEASGSTGVSTSTTATTAPSATTATPSTTMKTPSSTTKTPSTSTSTGTTNTTTTTPTTTTGSSSMTGSAGVVGTNSTTTTTTIEFSCDSTFYSAWSTMGLTCGGTELDVMSAAASTECLIYSGTSSGTEISDLATCMSVCRFPACSNGTWDYTASDGINSDIYAGLDFITLMSYAGTQAAASVADAVQQPFSNLTFAAATECDYTSDNSFGACQCAGVTSSTPSAGAGGTSTSSNAQYSVPANKGLEDANHWADGTAKSTVDKAGIASTTIGSSAATVSVVAGGVMSVASGVVGGTSAGVASGVSAAASVGITMAAVDICQFSIMLNQMNVDARPRFMENMGKKMAPAAFNFLPFGKNNASSSSDDANSTNSGSGSSYSRRLTTGSSTSGSSGSGSSSTTTGVQGMEKYASLIGVDPDMLFYLAVAGIACMVAVLFGAYAVAMGACYFFVQDFPTFSKKWLDKAIGVLMMILILSEYVVGATAMYQICYCIDHDSIDVSFFLAILTLLGLAFGTILYGVLVIKNNEDELRDLGTKDHFDKKFHARYGPLYDEHSFEGRFFFAPKLLLALLCGMTTGMVWIQGLWQIIVLIAFHIAFLLYLEIKQPYPTAFVQKTSSFVIIIKISALFLSFFLLSSATSFTESIPDDLREGVAFAIVGLQVLVLVCLMIRQVYIFYRTWKLKRDGASEDDKAVTVQTTNAREGSEAFFALGGEPQYYNNNQSRGGSMVVLGDDATPKMQDPRQYAQETPSNANYYGNRPLRGLQPQGNNHMQRTHTVVQHENNHRINEVDL